MLMLGCQSSNARFMGKMKTRYGDYSGIVHCGIQPQRQALRFFQLLGRMRGKRTYSQAKGIAGFPSAAEVLVGLCLCLTKGRVRGLIHVSFLVDSDSRTPAVNWINH